MQSIVGPQRMRLQHRTTLGDDWRRYGNESVRLGHMRHDLLSKNPRLVSLQVAFPNPTLQGTNEFGLG
jgi:hypothetical protein